ncbi:hypothetical protein B0H21DRAFT_701777, partial [Amylocystis lapponica]
VQEKVRRYTLQMMGRDSRQSPIPVASEQDIDLFKNKKHAGPTKDNFCVNLTAGALRSGWNKQAAKVFAKSFVEIDWSGCTDTEIAKELFLTHLIALRQQYQKHAVGPESELSTDSIERRRKGHRERRRRDLRERRAAASKLSGLRHFHDLWKTIPYTAMSGDESQPETGRYVVTRLPWRSVQAEEWLMVFDWMHLSTRFNANRKPNSGRFPHRRSRGSQRIESECNPVPGLPKNFYDQAWLNGLPEDDQIELRMQPEVDLTHSEAVRKYVLSPASRLVSR